MTSQYTSSCLDPNASGGDAARRAASVLIEQVFKTFFFAVDAAGNCPAARKAIDVGPVKFGLRGLIPRVRHQARLDELYDADDELAQSFFAKAFEVGLTWYEPRFSYTQYASYLLFDVSQPLRTMQRRAERESGAPGEALLSLQGAVSSNGQIRDELCCYENAVKELNALGERLRAPALRVWVDGLRGKQAAAELGVTPAAVAVLLHRARRRLRQNHAAATRRLHRGRR